jgi:hypothetical protein
MSYALIGNTLIIASLIAPVLLISGSMDKGTRNTGNSTLDYLIGRQHGKIGSLEFYHTAEYLEGWKEGNCERTDFTIDCQQTPDSFNVIN